MSKTKRLRRKAADWSVLVEACERSGLSRAAFAEREGIHPGTFGFWASRLAPKRLKSPGGAKVSAPSGFVPVQIGSRVARPAEVMAGKVSTKGQTSNPVEVVLSNGRRVRFDLSSAADPRLATLLALAEGGRRC
jgi:hypothetical protein